MQLGSRGDKGELVILIGNDVFGLTWWYNDEQESNFRESVENEMSVLVCRICILIEVLY